MVVQNLTQGTTTTVPSGSSLVITDVTALDELKTDPALTIYPIPAVGKVRVSFYTEQRGNAQIHVFSIDGKSVLNAVKILNSGHNLFGLTLPNGIFILQLSENGKQHTAKIISQSNNIKAGIEFTGEEAKQNSTLQRSKSTDVPFTYKTGDIFLFKGISGNYSSVVAEKITGNKNINFNFVECKDADGNYYATVNIGTQVWMAENLKTTKYRNADSIGTTTPANKDISGESAPKYQWAYKGDESYVAKYGRLYSWFTVVDSRKIAPTGWHVATDAEWTNLQNYLITNGYNFDGTKTGNKMAKSLAASTDWATYIGDGCIGDNLSKNNSSGFTALPGGGRSTGVGGVFYSIGLNGFWWSSTNYDTDRAWFRQLDYRGTSIGVILSTKFYGFSVRCVKD